MCEKEFKYEYYYDNDSKTITNFLEPEYLDYLKNLPEYLWSKYHKQIKWKLLEIDNEEIIKFVLSKKKFNYLSNCYGFRIMNLFLLKMSTPEDELIIHLENIVTCLSCNIKTYYHDHNLLYYIYINNTLEFNKYILDLIKNIENRYLAISVYFKVDLKYDDLPKYLEVYYYYIKIQNLENDIKTLNLNNKINLFLKICYKYSFTFEELIKLKDFMNISDINFVSKLFYKIWHKLTFDELIKLKDFMNISDINFVSNILFNISNEIINYLPIIENITNKYKNIVFAFWKLNKDNIIEKIFTNMIHYRNQNYIKNFYNYLNSINIINNMLLTNILEFIIDNLINCNCENIIYDFLNLGAEIKKQDSKYKIYHKYQKSIRILVIKN
jgi:hypothetical protein